MPCLLSWRRRRVGSMDAVSCQRLPMPRLSSGCAKASDPCWPRTSSPGPTYPRRICAIKGPEGIHQLTATLLHICTAWCVPPQRQGLAGHTYVQHGAYHLKDRDWQVIRMYRLNLTFLNRAPFFQNGAKSGFEMCFGPSTLGAGAKTRLESRIKEFTPHCVCRNVSPSTGTYLITSACTCVAFHPLRTYLHTKPAQ